MSKNSKLRGTFHLSRPLSVPLSFTAVAKRSDLKRRPRPHAKLPAVVVVATGEMIPFEHLNLFKMLGDKGLCLYCGIKHLIMHQQQRLYFSFSCRH